MKTRLFILLTLCSFTLGLAQNTIKGKVIDDEKNSLEAVVVSLINAQNQKFIKAALTNEAGLFSISNIKNGKYLIKISSLGYKETVKEFELNKSINFGTIQLLTETENLDEIVIKSEKPMVQVLADKTIFNIQNTINAAGDSGFDLLRKAPGIIVDNNDNVIVEGKTGVLFYIDGKPSVLRGQDLINFLKTLQSSDIESIEIITQPSSKYDAEGNAGIVNIVLKRDKSLGINGTIGTGFAYGDFARYNNSVSFNNRNKKTSLYGTFSNRVGNNFNFINLYRTQANTIFDAQTETQTYNNSNNARFGFDYYVSKKSTFGVIFSGNFNAGDSDSDSRTPIIPIGNVTPNQVLVAGSDTDSEISNLYGNINYKFNNKKGRTLNIDVDFGKYTSDRNNLQPNRYFDGTETIILSEIINYMVTPITIELITSKVDYEQNLGKGKLSLGVKFSKINTENQFDFYDRINGLDIINLDRTNNFAYDEQINAGYINYNRRFKKLSIQAGVRVEQTSSDGILTSAQANNDNRVKRNYTDFFPSGGLTYQANQNNSLALTYSKRIQRPNYQSLNPFEYKIDELSSSQGNPFLQPQYTDNIKFSHTYKYTLNTSISYSFIRDYSAQITEVAGINQSVLIARNVANQKVVNFGLSYPTRFNKWWNVYLSVNAYRSMFEATNEDFVAISQNTLSLYAQNTFKLPNNFRAEVSGWYSSPSIWGGTYRTKSLGSLNLAIQKKIMNNRMTLRFAVNDVLFTSPWRGDTRFGDLTIIGNGGNDSRQFRINLTYNFGRNEIKKARKRNTGIEDEKNRIGK
ncbi:MAG: TonB-dependent receptor [Flavobacteriaceae bacterium]